MCPYPYLFLLVEVEPQEFQFRHVYSLRLVPVHLQIQLSFDVVGDAFFDSFRRFSCFNKYHKVVSVLHKPEPSLLEFGV
mgnify:CR=1 FL=1